MCFLKTLNRHSPHDMNYENNSARHELLPLKHPKPQRPLSVLLDAHHNSMVNLYCWRHHTPVAGHRKLDLELTQSLFPSWIAFTALRSAMQGSRRENTSIVLSSTGHRMLQYQLHRRDVLLMQKWKDYWWGNQSLSWLNPTRRLLYRREFMPAL